MSCSHLMLLRCQIRRRVQRYKGRRLAPLGSRGYDSDRILSPKTFHVPVARGVANRSLSIAEESRILVVSKFSAAWRKTRLQARFSSTHVNSPLRSPSGMSCALSQPYGCLGCDAIVQLLVPYANTPFPLGPASCGRQAYERHRHG